MGDVISFFGFQIIINVTKLGIERHSSHNLVSIISFPLLGQRANGNKARQSWANKSISLIPFQM